MVSLVCCLGRSTATLEVINLLMTESMRFRYLSVRKTSLKHSHSSEKCAQDDDSRRAIKHGDEQAMLVAAVHMADDAGVALCLSS